MPLTGMMLAVVWIAAVGLGVYQYGRSRGRIGTALGTLFGGGMLGTFIIQPELLTTTIPRLFGNALDWLLNQGGVGGSTDAVVTLLDVLPGVL